MMRSTKRAVTAAALLAFVQGCSLFESSEGDSKDNVVAVQGGSGATGSGGAGAAAGGAGGAAPATCNGLAGPPMVLLQSPGGTPYCIDRTEVTQADYALFLKETTSKPGSEDSRCQVNGSYAPVNNPEQPLENMGCTNSFNPATTPNHPVVCVDWCDAQAYCKWAGKRLCGKIGAGSATGSINPDDPNDPAKDASLSQWFNACSQGGKTKFPYGDTYDPGACLGPGKELAAVGTSASCRGAAAPFSSILDLSGSVAEFTDECGTFTYGYRCADRGGGIGQTVEPTCALYGTIILGQYGSGTGFRCCKDLP